MLLATVASHGLSDGLGTFWSDLNRFARQALLLTLWTAAFMTAINVVMGTYRLCASAILFLVSPYSTP